MAMQSVPTHAHRELTLPEVDRASQLLYQATAIVNLIRASADSGELTDIAITGSCWAVEDKLAELRTLVTGEAGWAK